MPQKTNLNVNPYYEDFDASKNFYKILFRPGYSIQTRELTQIQSILQNQVESFGKYAFKQGDLVVPGEVGLNTKLDYVKLSSVSEVAVSDGDDIVYKKYDISQLIGLQIIRVSYIGFTKSPFSHWCADSKTQLPLNYPFFLSPFGFFFHFLF